MNIGIDIDGVLAIFHEGFIKKLIKVTGKDKFPSHPPPIPVWDFPTHYGYTKEEVEATWANIKTDPTFWFTLNAFYDVHYAMLNFERWNNWGDNRIYFITDRPGIRAKQQTEGWLARFGTFIPTVLISKEKGSLALALKLDYYIDDKPENVNEVANTGTTTFLMNRSWNENVEVNKEVVRVYGLSGFIQLVEGNGKL